MMNHFPNDGDVTICKHFKQSPFPLDCSGSFPETTKCIHDGNAVLEDWTMGGRWGVLDAQLLLSHGVQHVAEALELPDLAKG